MSGIDYFLKRTEEYMQTKNVVPMSVIEDIMKEIDIKRIRKNPKNDFIDGYNLALFDVLEIIGKHISGKENTDADND